MKDDLIPFDFAGKYFTPSSVSVYTNGKICCNEYVETKHGWKEKMILDESDKDSKEFGEFLRSKLLPTGGRARIDSNGNVYLRGKQVNHIDFNPKWKIAERRSGEEIWTDLIGKLWGADK